MSEKKTVLVTGMSGLIGGVVRGQLEDNYSLRALNRSAVEGVETHQASIRDYDAMRPAFDGVDIVVHLAAVAEVYAPWEDLLQTNVIGTRNVFEAAKEAGVQRVVFASSGSTIAAIEREEPYKALSEGRYEDLPQSWPMMTKTSELRPWGVYGASKVWGEALARHYVDDFDMSILCLRIGVVNAENRPTQPRHFPTWCSQRDIARMVELCVEAPAELKYDIFYVVSNNRYGYRDISHAREVLGFVPQDSADDYLDEAE
jgi:NAD+ dependent glucose-6-phosphate dehydrogenase